MKLGGNKNRIGKQGTSAEFYVMYFTDLWPDSGGLWVASDEIGWFCLEDAR